jgi:hypothetical protein
MTDSPFTPAPPPAPAPAPNATPPDTDFPGKTLGIVGLIVAVFANVVGLVISAIALSQSKRAGRKNSPALAGIIVGGVLFVISIIVGIVVVLAVVNAAITESSIGSDPGSATLSPTADPDETDPDATQTDVYSIVVGDCLDDQSGTEVLEVPLVDCAAPHDFEVYSDFDVAGDAYPGDDEIGEQADTGCFDAFEPFVGTSYEESQLNYTYYVPTESSWTAGDRLVSCMILDPAGKSSGTLAGAQR